MTEDWKHGKVLLFIVNDNPLTFTVNSVNLDHNGKYHYNSRLFKKLPMLARKNISLQQGIHWESITYLCSYCECDEEIKDELSGRIDEDSRVEPFGVLGNKWTNVGMFLICQTICNKCGGRIKMPFIIWKDWKEPFYEFHTEDGL